jgi:hypothetical protein
METVSPPVSPKVVAKDLDDPEPKVMAELCQDIVEGCFTALATTRIGGRGIPAAVRPIRLRRACPDRVALADALTEHAHIVFESAAQQCSALRGSTASYRFEYCSSSPSLSSGSTSSPNS